jgi:hypothetical protein
VINKDVGINKAARAKRSILKHASSLRPFEDNAVSYPIIAALIVDRRRATAVYYFLARAAPQNKISGTKISGIKIAARIAATRCGAVL